MNKKFVIFFFLFQIIFLIPYGLAEEKTYDWSKKSDWPKTAEEYLKDRQKEWEEAEYLREKEWKEKQEEMKEEREYLENTKTIKDEGDGVYRKIYKNGRQYLCIKQSLGYEICKKTPY